MVKQIKYRKDGKDCRNCIHKNEHMLYCQDAQCPDKKLGFHAFESDKNG
jgi:hypothetical protein